MASRPREFGSRATSFGACAELTYAIDALEAEIAELVAQVAPRLLAEPGVGPLTAAKLVGEIAGAERFTSAASWPEPPASPPSPPAQDAPTDTA